jgi:hypothetical protein
VQEEILKLVIFAFSLLLSFPFSTASAQLTKIAVGYGAISSAQFPAWMAKETGTYQKNGWMCSLSFSEEAPRR